MAGDWSDEQNDAIIADYFAMLADDIAGRPYSKAAHKRLPQAMIGRRRGSIEYNGENRRRNYAIAAVSPTPARLFKQNIGVWVGLNHSHSIVSNPARPLI